MPYRVAIRTAADKRVKRLPAQLRRRIYAGLDDLKEDPLSPRPGADIKPLQGDRAQYRLRVGDYRILYVVDGDIVYVTDVLHRARAYE